MAFQTLAEAAALRSRFVVGQKTEIEYRKGFNSANQPATMEIEHVHDVDAVGEIVPPVQVNGKGEYFFIVASNTTVESEAQARTLLK